MFMKKVIVMGLITLFLAACSQNEPDTAENNATQTAQEVSAKIDSVTKPEQVSVVDEVHEILDKAEQNAEESIAEVKDQAQTKMEEIKTSAEQTVDAVIASAGDKPYQVIDGKISANAIEGWKTYNGGGCGACHGKGAVGSVGPNVGESVVNKLSKEEFMEIVINGKPGTLMRANTANKRVMDNLDNLYAYLYARGDGVLGPGNLIKSPFGKE
jgi:mono/diheme cytochrome c family protein